MASILQGVDNLYEIDEVRPILDRAAELTGKRYGAHSGHVAAESHPDDVRLRVIADHVRTALMLIGDGVTPSNEGRGYVLRRIMRRAIRAMRLLGWQDRALPELLPVARDCMAPSYPEVADGLRPDLAVRVRARRRRSCPPCGRARRSSTPRSPRPRRRGGKTLSGDKAFQLHDTYGFPIDLTLEIAAEQGLTVDEDGFRRLMAEQRHPGQGRRAGAQDRPRRPVGVPVGARRGRPGRVHRLRRGGPRVEGAGAARRRRPGRGRRARATTVELVLDATPFYAEGGGQQPDHGPDHGRRRPARGARRAAAAARPDRAPRRGCVQRRGARRARPGYAEIDVDPAPGDLPRRTPRPTWCTRRCATSSASRRPRRVR